MADFVRVPKADWTDICDAVREKTETTDMLLSGIIAGMVRGIQAGSGGLVYDMGEFVLDADTPGVLTADGIPHQLGDVPDFILIWTDAFANLSAENANPYGHHLSLGYCWLNGLFGLDQRITSSASSDCGVFIAFVLGTGSYHIQASVPTSPTYFMSANYLPTDEKIALVLMNNTQQKWKAGVTYKYFVSKAWWNVGGVANAE